MKHVKLFEAFVTNMNEASKFKKGDTITSKVNDNDLEYSLYDLTNDVDGITMSKGTKFEIVKFNKKEETVELQGVNGDENEYSLEVTDLQFFESYKSVNEAYSKSDIRKIQAFANDVAEEIYDTYEDQFLDDEDDLDVEPYTQKNMLDYILAWGEDNDLTCKEVISDFDWNELRSELGLN